MKIVDVAKICHEANKVFCVSIGDFSQVPQVIAPENIKQSVITGVEFHLAGKYTPEESHNSWIEFKVNDGWVYGPEKDSEKKKTHPCLVPYNELPEEQQIKDYLFSGIVDSLKKFIK